MLLIHNLLEMASITIGFIIFFIAWYRIYQNNSLQVTIISLVILLNSIFDLAHMLTFPGMPGTENIQPVVWVTYWILARLTWSLGFLYTLCLPSNGISYYHPGKTILYSALLLVAGFIATLTWDFSKWNFFYISDLDQWPAIYAQYVAIVATTLALLVLHHYHPPHLTSKLLQWALLISLIANISFLIDMRVSSSINLFGQFCKTLAHYYVLRVMYIIVIRQPYEEMLRLKDETGALAAKNAQLYKESEQQRNLIEDTLSKIGVVMSSQLNVKETLSVIADMIADMMHTHQSCIAVLHKDRSSLQVVGTSGINNSPSFIPLETSLAGQVLNEKSPLYINDLSLHPDLFRPQLIFSSIRSIVCAPLVNDKQVIGIIEAYSSEVNAYGQRDALLLEALGHHSGAAISSAMLYEETKLRLDEEKFLYRIVQSAAATFDTDTIMKEGTNHAVQALNADVGLGMITGSCPNELSIKATVGLTCSALTINIRDYPNLGGILDAYSPAATSTDIFPPILEYCSDCIVRHVITLPLIVDHRLLGAILLGWEFAPPPGRFERMTFADLMAQQIALGLEKAQLYNQVKAMALSDGLTGLANRRNFDMFLKAELRRAASLKRPLSLIMLDLDRFKTFNDTYGHLTGDALLAELGKILRQYVRSIDFPARYGGEEFCVILPECSAAEAGVIAQKLRRAVEEAQFPGRFEMTCTRITASFCTSTYDPCITSVAPSMEKLIEIADKALYEAKQQGRNCVISATVI